MHAARSIHLHMHETGELASGGGCPKQRLLWASPPYGPSCLLATGHEGDCEFPATWVDPKTGRTIDVATHGRVTAVRAEGATA